MKPEFDPELISAYLDGETVSQEERELVKRHLAESSADAGMLNDFREVGKMMRDLPTEATPPGLPKAVQNQLERETLLSRPASKPARVKWAIRPVQLIASVSLLMLFMSVGTIYFIQNQLTTVNDSEAVIAMNQSPPGAGEVMFDESFALLDSTEFSLKSASTDDSVMESERSPAVLAMSRAKGDDANKLATMKSEGLASRSAISEETLLPEMRAVKPSAPAAITASPHGIPPLPTLLSKQSIKYINTLAASPKLQGILEPGELVHYVASNSHGQNISVVELSVVDVEEAFGTIQVLLTNNQIVSVEQAEELETENNAVALKSPADIDSNKDGQNGIQHKKNLQNKLSENQKEQLKSKGMIAFYVDASHEQVLNSLLQIDEIDNVRNVHFGNAPNLTGTSYVVESLIENSTTRFDINNEISFVSQKPKPGEEQKKDTLSGRTNSPSTDPAPRWTFSNSTADIYSDRPHSLLEGKTNSTYATETQKRKKTGLEKNSDKEQAKAINKKAPATTSKQQTNEAGSNRLEQQIASTVINSYQIPVRLLPLLENNHAGLSLSEKRKIPADSKTLEESNNSFEVTNRNERQAGLNNHLRLLLIISLRKEE